MRQQQIHPEPPEKPRLSKEDLQYLHDWLLDGRDIEKLDKLVNEAKARPLKQRRSNGKLKSDRYISSAKWPEMAASQGHRNIRARGEMKRGWAILIDFARHVERYNMELEAWKQRHSRGDK